MESFGERQQDRFQTGCTLTWNMSAHTVMFRSFQAEEILFQHIEEVHKVRRSKYREDNPYFCINAQMQCCHICGKETTNIRDHLKKEQHGINAELYFMRFVYMPICFEPGKGYFTYESEIEGRFEAEKEYSNGFMETEGTLSNENQELSAHENGDAELFVLVSGSSQDAVGKEIPPVTDAFFTKEITSSIDNQNKNESNCSEVNEYEASYRCEQ